VYEDLRQEHVFISAATKWKLAAKPCSEHDDQAAFVTDE
jgi:hypothetical protein